MRNFFSFIILVLILLLSASFAHAANETTKPDAKQKPKGPPPAVVVTTQATHGKVHPQTEIIGTVYFPEVSKVASEVSGRVEDIAFEAGQSVKKGDVLVTVNADLVLKDMEAAEADHKRVLTNLENAKIELGRTSKLVKSQSVTPQEHDKARYLVMAMENQALVLEAKHRRMKLHFDKAQTHAPFDGVILERSCERGEWLNAGSVVAVLARNDVMDVVVNVPQQFLPHAKIGASVELKIAGKSLQGTLHAVIPRGDIATRTFPVKIRVKNHVGLAEGMEARVRVPSSMMIEAVLVPRDGVLLSRGQQVVWLARNGVATVVPVKVLAYKGMNVAVRALAPNSGLQAGVDVVVKGNERLRPGQPVIITGATTQAAPKKTETPTQKQ